MPKRTPEQTAGRDRRSLTRPADFDALPRRFKDYVQTLESALYAARKTLDQPPTRVRLEPRNTLTGDPLVRYLPESEAVKFYTGGPDKHSAIEVRLTPCGTRVSVRSTFLRLRILPMVSNEVEIDQDR